MQVCNSHNTTTRIITTKNPLHIVNEKIVENAVEKESDQKTIYIDEKWLNEKPNEKTKSKSKSKNQNQNQNQNEENKIPKVRVVAQSNRWKKEFSLNDFSVESQLELLKYLGSSEDFSQNQNPKVHLLFRQLQYKLDGYRKQDIEKKRYNEDSFVTYLYVVDQLLKSQLLCFYCKENVKVLYEESRDPKQWTLERIDNSEGHNENNIEVACLTCNVRRRTMYHEKYRFTKQLTIQKV